MPNLYLQARKFEVYPRKIVKHFKSKWDVSLGRLTISEVLKSKEKWLTISKEISYMKQHRQGNHSDLERALFLWFGDMQTKNAIISDNKL